MRSITDDEVYPNYVLCVAVRACGRQTERCAFGYTPELSDRFPLSQECAVGAEG
jgi:hypothetical protein